MIDINDTSIMVTDETVDNNDVLRHIVEKYGRSAATKAAVLRAMIEDIVLPTPKEIIRKSGSWMIDEELTERLGVIVVDGRKVAAADNAIDLADFFEVVEAIYGSREEFAFLDGRSGSCLVDGVIFIGADVPVECRIFAAYHEYKHRFDYVTHNVVRPLLAHASIRSSRVEKECDLYALLRVISVWIEDEKGDFPVESVIEWMVHSHYQWEVEHPQQVSDLLYRAVLLYRFARQHGIKVDPVFDMKKLQKSKRWWE